MDASEPIDDVGSGMAGDTVVQTRDLRKSYRQGGLDVCALAGVSFSVSSGEFTALVGPSGSGKSTLLNLLGALDTPSGGSVMVNGEDLSKLSRAALAQFRLSRLGFVFQDYNLLPVLSALENVEYVLLLQGVSGLERRRRAERALEQVDLGAMGHRRPGELSGGQQQRVAVARAIVSEPMLILADEPTANLDSETGESLLDLMCQLNKRLGATFIISTHDPMVMSHVRRIIRLKDGHLLEDSNSAPSANCLA